MPRTKPNDVIATLDDKFADLLKYIFSIEEMELSKTGKAKILLELKWFTHSTVESIVDWVGEIEGEK